MKPVQRVMSIQKEELYSLPEEEAKRLIKEASIYASSKRAEVEAKARLMMMSILVNDKIKYQRVL